MGTPHKWAAVIKSWADGAEIQYKSRDDYKWIDLLTLTPSWSNSMEYRIKPQTIKYRVALIKGDGFCHTATANSKEGESHITELFPNFSRWLTDWVEVEV